MKRVLRTAARLGYLIAVVVVFTARVAFAQSAAGASSQPVVAVPLPGADPVFDGRVKAIASRLRCPVCQGESIQDSPAELSTQMKTLVREQLANGKTEREVMDYFVQKYGQWILLEPKAEGINLLVYWLPVLFLAAGGAVIWLAVRKWTRPVATEAEAGAVSPPPASAP